MKPVNFDFILISHSLWFLLDEADRSPSATSTTTTGSVLRSKDLRSVVENKRRNFGRSGSSSDSEDNASSHETYRPSNRKHAYSPTFPDSESTIYSTNHRGRSFSNIDHVSTDPFGSGLAGGSVNTSLDNAKRRSFSRTSSIISNNRLVAAGTTDEINGDLSGHNSFTHLPERTHSLSVDHRLANPSQMSISSRISIRYSTPRESTVFTKSEAPAVVRLIQQTPHQDAAEAIRTIIEHQRNQPEPIQKAIIVEEDLSAPVISQYNTTSNATTNEKSSHSRTTSQGENTSTHPPVNMTKPDLQRRTSSQMAPASSTSSSRSMLSTLKYSLIKHQQRKSTREEGTGSEEKTKHSVHHQQNRSCCSIS